MPPVGCRTGSGGASPGPFAGPPPAAANPAAKPLPVHDTAESPNLSTKPGQLQFVLLPFFEQISVSLEWAARVHGAGRLHVFRRIVLPLAAPGLLTAGLLVLVNTVANFELTFLLSGAGSQTLVVALYYAVFAAGMRPIYSVDAMAVIYMVLVLAILLVALRFVRPTQMVFRLDRR
jgi:putative spermidine/putrescine transport system permease protein